MTRRHTFYPLPRELHSELGIREYLGLSMMAAFGIYLLFLSGSSSVDREWLRAAFFTTSGMTCIGFLALIWSGYSGRRRITVEGTSVLPGKNGLVIPWSRPHLYATLLAFGSLVPAGLLLSIGLWSGLLDIPLTAGQAGIFSIIGLPLSLLAIGVIAVHVSMQRTRSLIISPTELTFPGVLSMQRTVRWADVRSIEMGPSTLGNAVVRLEVRRSGGQNNSKRAIYAERFSIGAAATFQLIRFYHDHPRSRDELGDNRSADRILTYGLMDEDAADRTGGVG
ncbi:hypothetical protein [Nocardia sp. SSK8]|uniref:hypothetical protein n=1 Tax=Nocardia sp. SSK8 TaxID=3120154 RepID=UPI00300B23E9